jgi:hypothetical protein
MRYDVCHYVHYIIIKILKFEFILIEILTFGPVCFWIKENTRKFEAVNSVVDARG